MKNNTLYIVIPCYNEEEVLPETTKQLKDKLNKLIKKNIISKNSRVMYVNDGSKDKTWDMIEDIAKKEQLFTGVKLSRNRGHQNALLAGLLTAKKYADMVISMDADLQDDINVIDDMVDKYNEGFDIVYGVRSSRKKDTWFKRTSAQSFYILMKKMGVDIVYNHADCRLMTKRTLEELENFSEVNLFLRGIVPLIGFNSTVVTYERNERFAGESKYPLRKMLAFAFDGITSFSIKPIRLILNMGIVFSVLSFFVLLYCLIQKITGNVVEGWTFIVCSIWLIAGIQLISLGVIGEYIGKIYNETKRRPRYIIEKELS